MLNSYPSIFTLGHKAVADLLTRPVRVEEKVDGSQFSFGLEERLTFRSKNQEVYWDESNMFFRGVKAITDIQQNIGLKQGWIYRGEYLQKPKHNTLTYSRIPNNYVIIYDIDKSGMGDYATPTEKREECERLGLECVPVLYTGMVNDLEFFQSLLTTTSILGGQIIEGVVIKPVGYDLFGVDKKVLLGKYVREEFKELNHTGHIKIGNKDIVALIGAKLKTEARWDKAVIHLRERGEIEDSPRDIGKLFKEINVDILKECTDEVKDALFKWAWPQISRMITAGMPEWYKEKLLQKQFEGVVTESISTT